MTGARRRVQGAACGVHRPACGSVCRVRRAARQAACAIGCALCLVPPVLALGLLPFVPTSAFAQMAAEPPPNELPAAEGVEPVRARCLGCHGADLITGQRLSEAGWGREIDKMVRWGAQVPEAERPVMLAYLARQFPATPAVSHAAGSAGAAHEGEAIFKRACLTCHGADLSEQQRLSPAGWTREVEKMIRWGATVADHEKPALAAYLAARFPIR